MDQRIKAVAGGNFGMGLANRRREGLQTVAETVDCRAHVRVALETTAIVERLRRVVRNLGSDGLCGNDSLDGS